MGTLRLSFLQGLARRGSWRAQIELSCLQGLARRGSWRAQIELSCLTGLARRGSGRAQIESVRVAAAVRGQGLGSLMIARAVTEATRRGCSLVQLTSDKHRTEAHRFYERLGFHATHEGMKLRLSRGRSQHVGSSGNGNGSVTHLGLTSSLDVDNL